MKILPILKECVTAAKQHPKQFIWAETDDSVLMSPDGLVMYKLPKGEVPITFKQGYTKILNDVWDRCLKNESYTPVQQVCVEPYWKDPKQVTLVFNDKVAILDKHRKKFDVTATFRVHRPMDPVLVLEDGEPAGVIMPVKRKEQKHE